MTPPGTCGLALLLGWDGGFGHLRRRILRPSPNGDVDRFGPPRNEKRANKATVAVAGMESRWSTAQATWAAFLHEHGINAVCCGYLFIFVMRTIKFPNYMYAICLYRQHIVPHHPFSFAKESSWFA